MWIWTSSWPSDAVTILGTKNTISDLLRWRRRAWRIRSDPCRDSNPRHLRGYQILGKEIIDCGVEDTEACPGWDCSMLPPADQRKRTAQVRKPVTGGGPILDRIRGQEVMYEIHMGVTASVDPAAFGDDGAVANCGLVIGTYLHGIFDNQNLRDAFLDFLYERKNSTGIKASGLKAEGKSHRANAQKGSGYRELALAVESHLDMEKVWQMLELEMPEAEDKAR